MWWNSSSLTLLALSKIKVLMALLSASMRKIATFARNNKSMCIIPSDLQQWGCIWTERSWSTFHTEEFAAEGLQMASAEDCCTACSENGIVMEVRTDGLYTLCPFVPTSSRNAPFFVQATMVLFLLFKKGKERFTWGFRWRRTVLERRLVLDLCGEWSLETLQWTNHNPLWSLWPGGFYTCIVLIYVFVPSLACLSVQTPRGSLFQRLGSRTECIFGFVGKHLCFKPHMGGYRKPLGGE